MRQYATKDELTQDYPDITQPGNVDLLLQAASGIVDRLLTGVVYDVDPATGLPTDTDQADTLKAATEAIVAEWCARGTTAAGGTQQWGSVTIGNVSLANLIGSAPGDGTTVDGLPIPALAITLLNSMGRATFYTSTPYTRPLDRIAR